LTRNATLRSLDLTANGLGAAGAAVLFAALGTGRGQNRTLQTLSLADNHIDLLSTPLTGGGTGGGGGCGGASSSTVHQQEELCRQHLQLVAQNRSVESLDLSGNRLGDDGVVMIAPLVGGAANGKLRSLRLAGAGLGPAGVTALMAALKANTALQVLGLTGNELGVEGAARVAEELKRDYFSELEYDELSVC
jgi:hypothetical protein